MNATARQSFALSLRERREAQARRLAVHLGVNPEALVAATEAVWSNMNPQSTHYDTALSIAGVALRAAMTVLAP